MTWKETCTVSERQAFIEAWLSRKFTTAELCARFNVSRKTGYKWINRFKALGVSGLHDHSRARRTQAHRTDEAVIDRILELKHQHVKWGLSRSVRPCIEKTRMDIGQQRALLEKF